MMDSFKGRENNCIAIHSKLLGTGKQQSTFPHRWSAQTIKLPTSEIGGESFNHLPLLSVVISTDSANGDMWVN